MSWTSQLVHILASTFEISSFPLVHLSLGTKYSYFGESLNPKVLCFVCKNLWYELVSSSPWYFKLVSFFPNNLEEFAQGSSLLASDWSLLLLPLLSYQDQFYTSPRMHTGVSGQELESLNLQWITDNNNTALASDLPVFTSWLCHLFAKWLQPS